MVKLHSIAVGATDTASALASLSQQIRERGLGADFIFAFYGATHDDRALHGFLRQSFPDAVLLGGSSCRGVMTDARFWDADSIGLLLVEDPDGDYGASGAEIGDDPAATAEATLLDALANAECSGELPELIWVYQAPGQEEEIVQGLRRVVGDRCPIVGGSSADDRVEGQWRQLWTGGTMANGLVVAVLFPSGGLGYAFQGGHEPAGHSGIVTRIGFDRGGPSGIVTRGRGRLIAEIDGEPASHVYNRWIGNRLDAKLAAGGHVLLDTTTCPLAIDAGQIGKVPHYLLIHPAAITAEGGLTTFAAIEEGTRIYSMQGDTSRLIDRAGRVASEAIAMLPEGAPTLAGGLMVYCAGCMLAVDERMPEVASKVAASFGEQPFLGCFTFGEQGRILQSNLHGNLMISAVVFGR